MKDTPAFPHTIEHLHEPVTTGMTLRDYFAAKAMQGELAALCDPENQIYGLSLNVSNEILARCAKHWYQIADAMLAARKQ